MGGQVLDRCQRNQAEQMHLDRPLRLQNQVEARRLDKRLLVLVDPGDNPLLQPWEGEKRPEKG